MSNNFRAFFYGEESGIFGTLRDFLFKMGMRGTVCTSHVEEIKSSIEDNVSPLVFIDHSPGSNEGFLLYESFRTEPGLELVPFFFLAIEDEKAYFKHGESFGAKGVIKKPFTPKEVTSLLAPLSSARHQQAHQKSLAVSQALAKGEPESILRPLSIIERYPYYSTGAGIAMARAFMRMEKYHLTQNKLAEMLRQSPNDLRVLCEVADLYIFCNKYPEGLKIFKRLQDLDIRVTVKIWEQLHTMLMMDDINGAATLLQRMSKVSNLKEPATAALLRIMNFMGLSDMCPQVAKTFPSLARLYPPNTTTSAANSSSRQGPGSDSKKK